MVVTQIRNELAGANPAALGLTSGTRAMHMHGKPGIIISRMCDYLSREAAEVGVRQHAG
jgi:hypothetical protein